MGGLFSLDFEENIEMHDYVAHSNLYNCLSDKGIAYYFNKQRM